MFYAKAMRDLPRDHSRQRLQAFYQKSGAGLVFVRGRRRIGKTWLLEDLESALGEGAFRIVCRKHTRDSAVLKEILVEWARRSGRRELLELRAAFLTWPRLFDDISAHAEAYKAATGRSFVLILDEIQWLSSTYDDSAGLLKAAWDEWAKKDCLRVIACGSSTKFFTEQFGEGSVIRGLHTEAEIRILPFPVSVIRRLLTSEWTIKETVLAYMCLGGVPYYWKQIAPEKGFRRAMNDACCTHSGIFRGEWKEILSTEFRTNAVGTLSRLFPALITAEAGATEAELTKELGLSNSYVGHMLEKLLLYGYVKKALPASGGDCFVDAAIPGNERGARYWLSDFYLYFYFFVLRPIEHEIERNDKALLFPSRILQGDGRDYIQSFTGRAFERFVEHHIDVAMRDSEELRDGDQRCLPTLWRKLDIPDLNYEVCWNVLVRGESNDRIRSQIDVLVVHEMERRVRVLECKWKGEGSAADIEDVVGKILPAKYSGYARINVLVVSYEPTVLFLKKAMERGVVVITLKDFID